MFLPVTVQPQQIVALKRRPTQGRSIVCAASRSRFGKSRVCGLRGLVRRTVAGLRHAPASASLSMSRKGARSLKKKGAIRASLEPQESGVAAPAEVSGCSRQRKSAGVRRLRGEDLGTASRELALFTSVSRRRRSRRLPCCRRSYPRSSIQARAR